MIEIDFDIEKKKRRNIGIFFHLHIQTCLTLETNEIDIYLFQFRSIYSITNVASHYAYKSMGWIMESMLNTHKRISQINAHILYSYFHWNFGLAIIVKITEKKTNYI